MVSLKKKRDIMYYILLFCTSVGSNPKAQNFLSHVLFLNVVIIILITNSFTTLRIYYDLSFDSFSVVAEATPILVTMIVKLVSVKLKHKQLKRLLNKMETFWPAEICPEIVNEMQKNRKFVNNFILIFFGSLCINMLSYNIKPVLQPFRSWPIDWQHHVCNIQNNLCFGFVYLWHIYSGILMLLTIGALDGFYILLAFNVYEQLKMIRWSFIHLKVTQDGKDLKQFYKIIDHHNYVLTCITDIDSVYDISILVQYWSSNFTTCVGIFFILYEGITTDLLQLIKSITYLSSFLMQIFYFCIFAQMITDECNDVAFAVFESKWYESNDMQWGKGVVLVTQRAQNSPKLTVGQMWELDLKTFAGVLQNSLSFCALIQSVYDFDSTF